MKNEKLNYLNNKYPDAVFPAPFAQKFNLNFTKLEQGSAHAEVVVDKTWTNPFGIAHGGFLFSILDEVLGSSACSVLDKPIYNDVKALSTTNHDIFFSFTSETR